MGALSGNGVFDDVRWQERHRSRLGINASCSFGENAWHLRHEIFSIPTP